MKNTVNLGGRPTAMTDVVMERLRTAFSIGCQYREACSYAKIAVSTLSKYITNNPEFTEQIKMWQANPTLKARQVVVTGIEKGDKRLAWDYLQAKCKEEFSTRIETTGKNGGAIQTTSVTQEESRKQADELDGEMNDL